MLFDVYDDVTGENYATYWTRAAAQAAVDAFHAENEISIEGETPRAVAPVWQRLDWRTLRLAPDRGRWPSGFDLNAGPSAPYAPWPTRARDTVHRTAGRLYDWLVAMRDDGWRGALCGWCRMRPTMADDCGWFYITPQGNDSRPCCRHCYNGAPGAAHRARYGTGER